jgi:hypothetical protein
MFQLFAAVEIDAGVLFPLITGGVIIVSAIFSTVLFREKTARFAMAGILIAVIAVMFFMERDIRLDEWAVDLTANGTYFASSQAEGNMAEMAFNAAPINFWQPSQEGDSWLEVSLIMPITVNKAVLSEYVAEGERPRVYLFSIEYFKDGTWEAAYRGRNIGGAKKTYMFPEVTGDRFRLYIRSDGETYGIYPRINHFELYGDDY